MDYRSFIKIDYNTLVVPAPRRAARRGWLRALLLAGGFAVLGVVLAKTQDHHALESDKPDPATVKHNTQKPATDTQPIEPLALPKLVRKTKYINQTADVQAAKLLPLPTILKTPAILEKPAISEKPVEESAEEQVEMAIEDPPQHQGKWHEVIIESGDTMSAIFSRLDIYKQLHSIMALGEKTELLNSIHPGQELRVRIGEGLEEMIYEPNEYQRLHIEKTENGLRAELLKQDIEVRQAHAHGVIKDNLFLAGRKAGLSDTMIMKLAEIFGWDIDFVLDVREVDHFTVIYEEHYRDGEKIGEGDIIAAEFVNRGTAYRALRYTDDQGKTAYYAPDGHSMRKPFMRNPVDFTRISSYFDPNRRHPILNTIRAHNGVDYAAPTGTPIKAAGDGKVVFRGVNGGYGNAIILQHGSNYSTLYGHMSDYASGASIGSRVEQGQVIGYVGSTGLATGPHLHYEFRVNGVHRNPLTVKLPAAEPLPENEMPVFAAAIEPLLDQLDTYTQSLLAAAGPERKGTEKTAASAE